MKRFITLSILTIFVSGSFISCKSHEKCPAYSKVETKAKTKI